MIELLIIGVLLLLVIFVGLMMFSIIVAYASQAAYIDPDYRHCLDCDELDCFECSCDRDCCEGK